MMRHAFFVMMAAFVLSGCARHARSPDDFRAALLQAGNGQSVTFTRNGMPDDGKMHGQITTGVAAFSGYGRGHGGVVPMESVDLTNVVPGLNVGAWSYGR